MFKQEDEDEYENNVPFQYEQNDGYIENRKTDYRGDIDTKVFYQYPKGQFKFPLIPDEPFDRDTSRINYEEKERPPTRTKRNHSIHPTDDTVRELNRNQERPVSPSNKSDTLIRKEAKPTNYHRRPFRPTEIPSPIYGYNSRPSRREQEISKEEIEYELTSFTSESLAMVEETEDILDIQNNKDEIDKNVTIDNGEEIGGHNEILVNEEEIDRDQIINNGEEVVDDNEILVNEEKLEDKNQIINNREEVVEENEILDNEAEFEEILDEILNEEELDDPSYENEIQASSIEEELSEVTKTQEENKVDVSEERSPRRSHLPFNVIMLKKDKQKIEKNVFLQTHPSQYVAASIEQDMEEELVELANEDSSFPEYQFPNKDLLNPPAIQDLNSDWLEHQENLLNETLLNFNVGAKVVNVTQGPAVTRFEVQPEPGVKVNKITNLSDDIKLSLAAKDIRIEAPIPGKHTIGIEVPNQSSRPVFISEIINSQEFKQSVSPLTAVLGLDISGKPIVTDLRKMPHGLIAGATGSGKSVCINSILVSLLYKANPDDLRLLLIDPKMVELAPYNQIPHLVSPVITDVKAATAALKWAVEEMERRYELFAHTGVRDITRFNELAVSHKRYTDKLPYILIIIDELADLMMMSPADVEEAICRIAQKARACGIHLIIATQRPSVDVITGLIKANVPTRIAFSVSSQIDSRTIIDIGGAEKLLGRGDMLFLENGSSKPVRLQGTFVSDLEIDDVVAHVRDEREPQYLFQQEELLKKAQITEEEDELFYEACEFVIDQGGASTSSIQRRFKIGYNRAARLIDMMENQGFISEARGSKPRDVLISEADLESIQDSNSMF